MIRNWIIALAVSVLFAGSAIAQTGESTEGEAAAAPEEEQLDPENAL